MIIQYIFLPLCILCSACTSSTKVGAGVQTTATAANSNDPLEPYNRSVMKLNNGFIKILIKPALTVYRTLVPKQLRGGIANVSANAKAPLIFAHDVLQGEGNRAAQTLGRFFMNSTVGLAGIIDVATKVGVPAHSEDAGQTFARWGLPSGPYLMLPLLGPSNFRDASGFAADIFADPLRYVLRGDDVRRNIGRGVMIGDVVTVLDQNVDRVDELQRGAIDPYIALREAYRHYRQAEIKNGKSATEKPDDDPLADVLDMAQ